MLPKNIFIYDLSVIPELEKIINDSESKSEMNILKINKCLSRNIPNNETYKVLRYEKNNLRYDLISTYGLFRSVILNSENKVVSFAPPKSIPSDIFIKKYQKSDSIIAQEFVEGTMINVFWDNKIGLSGGWEISTRNTVGATSCFFKSKNSKSFRDMFLEACKKVNLQLMSLNPEYCYSFVLQHPQNRIVVPFEKSQLYLVGMYKIVNNSPDDIKVHSFVINEIFDSKVWENTQILYPEIYKYESYSELIEKYASMNTSYNILGFVLYNKETGERCKIRNPVYEQVRQLRGNQPKLQFQYLSLRKEGKVKEFLKVYPEYKKEFFEFRQQIHLFTNTLFSNYISCYIKKEKPLREFSDQYRTHMFKIHQIYMDELKENNLYVTNTVVIKYVNSLESSLLMYCLNFHMRKRKIDFQNAEKSE